MAEEVLTNYETGSDETQALGDSGDVDYIHSQSFQIQKNATITKIELQMQDGPGVPADDVTIRIETDDGAGEPSGNLVHTNATGTISQASIGAAWAWVECTFSSFNLTKDTTYHLRISIPNQATNVRTHLTADSSSPTYAHGSQVRSTDQGANWTIQATHDLYFRVYGNPVVIVLLDSDVTANQSTLLNLQDNHPSDQASYVSAGGQALTLTSNVKTITSVKFYLKKSNSPTGNATAQIYASTGTVGSTGKPTGAALATSGNLDLSTLTTDYVLYELTFTPLDITGGNSYCIVFVNPASGVDASNYPIMGAGSSATHGGNTCYYLNSAWGTDGNIDTIFYLYGTKSEGGSFLLNFI